MYSPVTSSRSCYDYRLANVDIPPMPSFNRQAGSSKEYQRRTSDNIDVGKKMRNEVNTLIDLAKM